MNVFKQVVLVVLDGFGAASASEGNAVSAANTKNLNFLINNFPAVTLQASGPSVGLPWGERGNSEVGHLNLGAGRIVSQDLPRINSSIASGEFFKNPVLLSAMDHAKKNNSKLHLVGLVSSGSVHSSEEHLHALLSMAADGGLKKVFVHMFTDGRDTPPKAASESLDKLAKLFLKLGVGKIATLAGRFYAMDRGGHWEVTERTFKAMVLGKGETAVNVREAINDYYAAQVFDETIPPTVIMEAGQAVARVEDGDSVIFFNFRPDRTVQLATALADPKFDKFSEKYPALQNMFYATMTLYDKDLPARPVFSPANLKNTLSEVVSQQKLKQFHVAESEKYAHVTSFFNGGRAEPFELEEREIVTSPANYEERYTNVPEMSAAKVAEKVIEKVKAGVPFVLVNFANADMVGHTGVKAACIKAVEALDAALGQIAEITLPSGAALLITADHGNIEQVVDPRTGIIDKEHSVNPVPLIVAAKSLNRKTPLVRGYLELSSQVPEGVLSDVSPTVLELLGLPKSPEMTALSLLPVLLKQTQ